MDWPEGASAPARHVYFASVALLLFGAARAVGDGWPGRPGIRPRPTVARWTCGTGRAWQQPSISLRLESETDVTWMGPGGSERIEVPHVVGLTVSAARRIASDRGLALAAPDPDGPPLGALTWPGVWVVTGQRPAAGAMLRRNGSLVVDFERAPDDLAGDREPRRPLPPRDSLAAQLDPATGNDLNR